MSIVACRIYSDRIEIASDSIRVHGDTQVKDDKTRPFCKLTRVENIIVGSVGLCEEMVLMNLFCGTHKPAHATTQGIVEFISEFADWMKKKTNKEYGVNNDYIIVCDGHAFYISSFFITEIDNYGAIGAGRDYALAAMYLGHDVQKAAETSCELSVYCEKPINFFVEPKGKE